MASNYTEASIKTLSSLEHIRLRPGMYIGRLGNGTHAEDGIYVLLKETIDNSIDEFTMGAGKKIEVEIDEERRRISLGMKQCKPNPWDEFAASHKKGDKVRGQIKSITDFGVFIGLPGGIDGLVHLSDLSWSATGEEAKQNYKKGDEVEAVVLSIDVEKERISLGIKQMDGDPFTSFVATHDKNSIVTGTVKSVDPRGAVIDLGGDVEGYLRASEFSRERIEDLRTMLKEGDSVEALIVNVDRKSRSLSLSIKAKDQVEQNEAMQKLAAASNASSGTTNLGALLKAKLNQQ